MMNRFKFRAWDKVEKRFIQNCWEENIRYILDTGELFINGTNFTDTFILCQYTGLKDKKKVEIYEDDIVKAILRTTKGEKIETIGVVKFSDFEYVIETDIHDWPVASWQCMQECLVIGNIHNNPELIPE